MGQNEKEVLSEPGYLPTYRLVSVESFSFAWDRSVCPQEVHIGVRTSWEEIVFCHTQDHGSRPLGPQIWEGALAV